MKLEITKEKVLEAASKCSQAKETLKTLFPEVFEDEKPEIVFNTAEVTINSMPAIYKHSFNHIHLDSCFKWSIEPEPDSIGYQLKFKKL